MRRDTRSVVTAHQRTEARKRTGREPSLAAAARRTRFKVGHPPSTEQELDSVPADLISLRRPRLIRRWVSARHRVAVRRARHRLSPQLHPQAMGCGPCRIPTPGNPEVPLEPRFPTPRETDRGIRPASSPHPTRARDSADSPERDELGPRGAPQTGSSPGTASPNWRPGRLAGLGRVSQPVRWLAGRLGGCRVLVCCLMPSGLGSNR